MATPSAAAATGPPAASAPDAAAQAAQAAQAALAQLHPLMQPVAPSWAPQTAGWAVLAVMWALLMLWAGRRALQRWRAGRHRRLALAQLQRLRADLAPSTPAAMRQAAARALPVLVRRLALAHAPRAEVAPLQGAAWSSWLDRSLGDASEPFTRGAGRHLGDWAYRPDAALPWTELEPLLALVERWIRRHRVPGASP